MKPLMRVSLAALLLAEKVIGRRSNITDSNRQHSTPKDAARVVDAEAKRQRKNAARLARGGK